MVFEIKPTMLLDRMRPSVTDDIEKRQVAQHRNRLNVARIHEFKVNQKVYVRFWYGSKRWKNRVLVARASPLSYDV